MQSEKNKWLFDLIKKSKLKVEDRIIIKKSGINILGEFVGIESDLQCLAKLVFRAKNSDMMNVLKSAGLVHTVVDLNLANSAIFCTNFELSEGSIAIENKAAWEEVNDWAVDHVLKVNKEKLSLKSLNAIASIAKSRMLKNGIDSSFIVIHMIELESKILDIIDSETVLYAETKDFWSNQNGGLCTF
jgi:hypothetical protein